MVDLTRYIWESQNAQKKNQLDLAYPSITLYNEHISNYNYHTITTGSFHALNYRKLSEDVLNSTTTLSTITGLTFALGSNMDYYFEYNIFYQSTLTTGGIGLGIITPIYVNSIIGQIAISTDLTGTYTTGVFRESNVATATTGTLDTKNTNLPARLWGIIKNSNTTGTLGLQFMSNNNGIIATIKSGSIGKLTII